MRLLARIAGLFVVARFRRMAPNLHRAFLVFAVTNTAMALNFLLLDPAFDPFGIDKDISGMVFLSVGLPQLLVLQFSNDLRLQRLIMATGISAMALWSVVLWLAAVVNEQTSWQLPIVCLGFAYLGLSTLFTTPSPEE